MEKEISKKTIRNVIKEWKRKMPKRLLERNEFFKEAIMLQYVCDTCSKFLSSEKDISNHLIEKEHNVHWIPIFKQEVIMALEWIKKIGGIIPLTHYNPCECCGQNYLQGSSNVRLR